mmetsp:Transcript_597/g.1195  ORF Transcript_597/g.1195 Transcript_597/m.1195 type:complete len:100 (-) Transcript_597:612-911(-)
MSCFCSARYFSLCPLGFILERKCDLRQSGDNNAVELAPQYCLNPGSHKFQRFNNFRVRKTRLPTVKTGGRLRIVDIYSGEARYILVSNIGGVFLVFYCD